MKRNIEVIHKCKAEVWSGVTKAWYQLEDEEYVVGDLISTFSSEVEGDDVSVVTDDPSSRTYVVLSVKILIV